MNLANEMLDHFFGDFEIGDHTVPHRPDRLDVARRAAKHHLGLLADGKHLLLSALFNDGDNRRFVQNDPPAFDIDESVRRAEIDCHIGREHAEQTGKHVFLFP